MELVNAMKSRKMQPYIKYETLEIKCAFRSLQKIVNFVIKFLVLLTEARVAFSRINLFCIFFKHLPSRRYFDSGTGIYHPIWRPPRNRFSCSGKRNIYIYFFSQKIQNWRLFSLVINGYRGLFPWD